MKDPLLTYIADYQLLKSGFCRAPGLMNGKTGIAVFFFLYSRYTRNPWYEEFAGELLKDVGDRLDVRLPVAFADGLCGIGWSIEFLAEQGFIEGDTDDILPEIDSKVMEYDPERISDRSFENGLEGIIAYVHSRLERREAGRPLPFDPVYLERLEKATRRLGPEESCTYGIDRIWKKTLACWSARPIPDDENWKKGLIFLQT